jgi:dTDP-4-amino-4,6-dideoxygalactose transaminase
VTESYARRTITLPLFPHMSDAQIELVLSAVTSASRRAGQRPARRTV